MMGRSSQVIAPNEGVVAHRERAAGREFGVTGSIPVCESPRICGALAHLILPVVQLRENTWNESGRCGFDSHREANLDGPLSLGYRLSEKSRAGSIPAPAANMAGFPTPFLPVGFLGSGRCISIIEPVAQLR